MKMSANDNAKTVQAIYEAFSRGDVAFILENVTDDIDWSIDSVSTAAPWHGRRQGKTEVAAFFEALGSAMTVNQFEPVAYGTNDDGEVFSVVKYKATRTANGRSEESNIHHYFRFRDGKVAYWRGTEDSSQVEALFRD
jgi:ketosteroid isomerase-like protein